LSYKTILRKTSTIVFGTISLLDFSFTKYIVPN
jgi:hypothetical protein